ncbi:transcriptional regulator [Sorangium sp. So ce1153]|uniref:transcriptional regulator n=1 Tax=Sorangium sp. So ce1153 TaxID=3133333 RepID=UPI003F607001
MLTLVRPEDVGQDEAPSKRRRPRSTALTDAEAMRLRAALKNIKGLFGSWDCLAEVMGVPKTTITNFVYGSHPSTTHGLALRAAKAAGTTVEQLLGGLAAADRCPHCGTTLEAP